jgi:hypothetical protein
MVLNFSAKQMISYDAEKSTENLSEKFAEVIEGLMSFPLNIPGTGYYKCLKVIYNIIDCRSRIIFSFQLRSNK